MDNLLSDMAPGETRALTFSVTQEDIDHGQARHCWQCPGARAINRALPGLLAGVDPHQVYLYEDDGNGELGQPFAVAHSSPDFGAFIETVDSDEQVTPGTFTLAFKRICD